MSRLAAVLWKDALRERRGKEAVQAALVLVLLFATTFLFTHNDLATAPAAAALLLWLPLLYGGITATARSFAAEADAGVLPLLRAAPVPLGLHGVARTLLHILVLAALAGFTLLVAVVGWGVAADATLLGVLLLGALGIAVVGTLTGALAAHARSREALLPVLAVPILLPLLQAGLRATLGALDGAAPGELRAPLLLMLGFDIAAAGVAWVLWPVVLEAD